MFFETYIGSTIYEELRRGIRDACTERGWVCDFFDARFRVEAFLASKAFARYRGILGTVSVFLPARGSWERLAARLPCVDLMIVPPRSRAHGIAVDDGAGIRAVVDHLVEAGHRSIGYFGMGREPFCVERARACLAALAQRGMAPPPAWVVGFDAATGMPKGGAAAPAPYTVQGDQKTERILDAQTKQFLNLAQRPSALVFENDLAARRFIRAAGALGFRIPGDLAVTGFDDNRFWDGPPRSVELTTVRQDFYALGVGAVALLDRAEKGGPRLVERQAPRLIVRRSSLRGPRGEAQGEEAFRAQVAPFIEAHLETRKLSGLLARKLGMSPKSFLAKFSREFGVTFVRHLNQLRLDRAAGRLRETRDPITRILHEAGFASHPNFNRQFKARFGVSAAAYRAGRGATGSEKGTSGKGKNA